MLYVLFVLLDRLDLPALDGPTQTDVQFVAAGGAVVGVRDLWQVIAHGERVIWCCTRTGSP
ncbi:hypothetical protein H7J77_10755 [Mycolicibacillus parakoreensis]|uniref:Uncharacterized protein n=1 Tax=Mycolicibacillus parakoreensis TaxID=1069221 RepID=A0ABY3TXG1_9MYCO|nr:hypothetical protein [Mycolicibacillus parakoreensis]MCV7316019.1 hypothetical protein [Mycolicibacillus parakoreensis]ULN52355.1 hypothetical protein MIU77_16160 [Mycolicibacillus parakoreensis]HLR99787.1 hypothetical protein [Mycolicibacillus parakoreensis]